MHCITKRKIDDKNINIDMKRERQTSASIITKYSYWIQLKKNKNKNNNHRFLCVHYESTANDYQLRTADIDAFIRKQIE